MEPSKAQKSTRTLALVLPAVVSAALLAFWAYSALHTVPLSKLVRSDLPMLELRLQFKDINGEKVAPAQSRLLGKAEGDEVKQPPAPPLPEGCPEIIGGDVKRDSQLSAKEKQVETNCPKIAQWHVIRHPISFTLTFQDAPKILSFFEGNTRVKELFETKFFQGLFHDPLHDASVRAEDLKLEGIEGAFLGRFLREALAAHAELHYDMAHGKRGFVFSFVRNECAFASKTLPVVVRILARSGYRLPTPAEPILEMRIGLQRIFLTQYKDRIYLANGLEALLNVLESLRSPDKKSLPRSDLVLTTRAEAFVDKLLPVAIGSPAWDMNLGFDVTPELPGVLQFGAGKFSNHLRPAIFKGALAGIPHDVFAAAATSYYLPAGMTTEEWHELASEGPGDRAADGPREAGFAILWDLSSEGDHISNMGVAIANQTAPDEIGKFKHYFRNSELTAACGGGTVFLAATSRKLLTRMKESCEGRSLSVLHWERGTRVKDYDGGQLFLFMNPGAGMREIFLAGGAKSGEPGNFEPKWKQEYAKAKEAMREDGEKVFSTLPIFAYSGSAAPSDEVVRLKGLTVKQGASR